MKHNKVLFPVLVGSILLTSCGLGEEISQEKYYIYIQNINTKTFAKVDINGILTTRFDDVESKINISYSYVYDGSSYVATKEDDVSNTMKKYLSTHILSDFEESKKDEDAQYFYKGEKSGYAIKYQIGDTKSESKDDAEIQYEYNVYGLYSKTFEHIYYINNNIKYESVLDLSFNWQD